MTESQKKPEPQEKGEGKRSLLARAGSMAFGAAADVTEAVTRPVTGFAVESIAGVVDAVLPYLTDNPQLDDLVRSQIDKVLPYLVAHPAVTELVRAQVQQALVDLQESEELQQLIRDQVHAYLGYLREHPEELQDVIRQQGDDYIDYLNLHPEAVQTLVQGQSIDMASDIRDEVRERTVTADSVVDLIVRNVLRRTPPDELPPPPESVRRRAEYGRLPSDYLEE